MRIISLCILIPLLGLLHHKPVRVVQYIESGVPGCLEAFELARDFYAAEGIEIRLSSSEVEHKFLCIPQLPRPFWSVSVRGFAGERVAWAEISGDLSDDSRVIVHELCHLLFDCSHTWQGVMTPYTNESSGFFSDYTLMEIERAG